MIEKKHFYVYQYIEKNNYTPFYVGKGTSDRKFAHMREARKAVIKGDHNRITCPFGGTDELQI